MSAASPWVSVGPLLPRQAELWAGVAIVAAGLIMLRVSNPVSSGLFPPCPFLWLTGFYCPGCGSLRAVHHLLQGDFAAAFSFNPFTILALPFVGYGAASRAAFLVRGRYLPHVFLPPWFIWSLGCAVILFGILRNLPAYPFRLLAPGGVWLD
jgi:hypothetical protein